MQREKREPWLKERRGEIIAKLNKDLQKPWFGAKKDGYVLVSSLYHHGLLRHSIALSLRISET